MTNKQAYAGLLARIGGRAAFCRDRGEIKTPELLEEAAEAISSLIKALQFRPVPSETFAYQADGYAAGWHAAIEQFKQNARAALNSDAPPLQPNKALKIIDAIISEAEKFKGGPRSEWALTLTQLRIIRDALDRSPAMQVSEADGCKVCFGRRGGVPGNENRIGDLVMCDYCHADHHLRHLKDCPFCGESGDGSLNGNLHFICNDGQTDHRVKCFGCGAEGGRCDNVERARYEWNTRAAEGSQSND